MSDKSRNWWFILYPESAPLDWLDILRARLIPFAVSPLHDRDITKDGSLKKPHYHIMLRFNGPTTYNHVLELTRSLGQPIPTRYDSPIAAYNYLSHENDQDKFHYSQTEIQLYNGFSVPNDQGETMDEITYKVLSYIIDNDICEFSYLVEMLLSEQLFQYVKCVRKNSYFYVSFLKSRKYIKIEPK